MDLTNINDVKGLQADMRGVFETGSGINVMKFLEQTCNWYDSVFDMDNRDYVLIKAGRREVVATIKTMLKCSAEEVVALTKQQGE